MQEKKEQQPQQQSQVTAQNQQEQDQQPPKQRNPSDNREELDFQFDEELTRTSDNTLSSYLPSSFFPQNRQNRRRTTSLTLDLHEEA